jgi:hypothetical protein
MHVHANQVNPYAQLDAMYSAQKAAAKRSAEQTRRKLLEFASALARDADSDACVVKLAAREEPQEHPRQQNQQGRLNRHRQAELDSEGTDNSISDWA